MRKNENEDKKKKNGKFQKIKVVLSQWYYYDHFY